MDDVSKIREAKDGLLPYSYDPEQMGRMLIALSIGWGLMQVAKGLSDIGKGFGEIAVAAKLGFFQ
jgi:hypothetical protein